MLLAEMLVSMAMVSCILKTENRLLESSHGEKWRGILVKELGKYLLGSGCGGLRRYVDVFG